PDSCYKNSLKNIKYFSLHSKTLEMQKKDGQLFGHNEPRTELKRFTSFAATAVKLIRSSDVGCKAV
ncbi:hypothetical protein EVA_22155, partial [gut metagenome]